MTDLHPFVSTREVLPERSALLPCLSAVMTSKGPPLSIFPVLRSSQDLQISSGHIRKKEKKNVDVDFSAVFFFFFQKLHLQRDSLQNGQEEVVLLNILNVQSSTPLICINFQMF